MNGRRDRKTVARILKNKKPLIKICGLTDSRAAAAAVDADFSGFVFAKSHRRIAPEAAAELLSEADSDTVSVGVFVDESTREILRSIEIAGIDVASNILFRGFPAGRTLPLRNSRPCSLRLPGARMGSAGAMPGLFLCHL